MTTFTLRRQDALAWSGEHEWRKGQSYVRGLTGLSARPERTATVLRGTAYGQEPYQVRATLEGGEVVSARCSCPVGGGGHCKHVAALLARAVEDPRAFAGVPELSEALSGLSVPELHRLISRMLDRAPELEALVYASSAPSAPAGSARGQIEAAFDAIRRTYNPEWDHEGEGPDTEAIDLVLEGADGLLENLDALDSAWAGQLLDTYLTVLDGIGDTYDGDFDWGLDDLQARALAAVQTLLVSGKLDEGAREDAFEAVQSEVASGRWNSDDEAFFDLVAALREDERASLLNLLRNLVKGERSEYLRQQYARALYHLTANDNLSDEEAEALLRASGNLGELLDFLLERGRTEDVRRAVREAGRRAHFPELEPVFAAHDQLPLLEALAHEGREQEQTRRWLFARYVATGRKPEAHALAREVVLKSPTPEWLISLKDVSPDWETERAEITSRLWRQKGHTEVLMDLLLREGLAQEALRLAGERDIVPVRQLLALAGQLDAERAVPLIVRAAQLHIDLRNRNGYHEAAQILSQLPTLVGRPEALTQVRAVVERQPRLPALRDELRQAGLL
ncbi:SWIM zinc finger family protein [Deinococcus apachensis]|uniref:SWIM zinc finger family protein n=1 Tax=Deinococcus apachensis TaxID=309886 RepID=UPI00035EBDA7|nr:SWIM zinc finger family protein [Deinococcus apachensis]